MTPPHGGPSRLIPPPPPPRAPYPPNGPSRTGGTRVLPLPRGEELEALSYMAPHGASLSPKTAEAGAEGLGCVRRCVGRSWKSSCTCPPRVVPIPQTAQAGPEGLGCIRRCVGGNREVNHTQPPTGRPQSPKWPRQHRGDSGVSAAVWGWDWRVTYPRPPDGGSLSPPRPRQDRRDSRVSAAV